jgi:hypothetical protein
VQENKKKRDEAGAEQQPRQALVRVAHAGWLSLGME